MKLSVKSFTWWLCILGGVVLQRRRRGSWGKRRCPGWTEVSVLGPRLSPWPGVCRQWTGEVAGALTGPAPQAGGAAGRLRCFSCCWISRGGELLQSTAGSQKAGAEEASSVMKHIVKIFFGLYINLIKQMHCVAEVRLYDNYRHNLSPPPPLQTGHLFMNLCAYVQISVRPHDGVWVAIVKERWLTTRDHSYELSVDLFLLFTNRLCKDDRDRWRKNNTQFSRNASPLSWYLTSCAVQWCLLVCRRPDEVLCVGLCITLIGNVFSYMLVQELVAMPRLKMQRKKCILK